MLNRIGHWLNQRLNLVADDESSAALEFWDRVDDHRPWCVCPTKALMPEVTCQTHHSTSVGDPSTAPPTCTE